MISTRIVSKNVCCTMMPERGMFKKCVANGDSEGWCENMCCK